MLLVDPRALESPFYALTPPPLHYPMVALATLATIIASQAVISGAFSLTRQAIQLGYLPRATIRHTSTAMPGQVYIPEVNVLLMVACVGLVLAFRESSRLASAYGMAVAGAMTATTILYFFVMRERWHWRIVLAGGLALAFLALDLAFLGANVVKIPHGAWVPFVVAGGVYTLMSTWKRGVDLLAASLAPVPVESFLRDMPERQPVQVPGVAVFLSTWTEAIPPELIHYTRRSRTLHERVILLVVSAVEVPRIAAAQRIEVRSLTANVLQVGMRYGFMESPDVPRALERSDVLTGARQEDVTFFIGRVTPVRTARPGMAQWRKALFAFLWFTSRPARLHLRIPAGQVVEVGMEVEL